MSEIITIYADGNSIDDDDMRWEVNCPECERRFEYLGFFDSAEPTKCECGCVFKTRKVYFSNGSYIE